MRRVPSRHRNRPLVVKEKDRDAFKRFSSLLTAAAILAVGFLYAGHQHFAALHLGYETEKLRDALTNAKEQQRRLAVQKEIATSPARLEQAARQLGMQPIQAAQFDPLRRPAETGAAKTPVTPKPVLNAPPKNKPQQPRVR